MNLDTSDVIATLALLATVGMWFKGRSFEKKVHVDQAEWQENQEEQRRAERAEDQALKLDEQTAKIKVSVLLTLYRSTYYGVPDGAGELLATDRVADLICVKAENWGRTEVKLMAPYLMLPDCNLLSFPMTHLANADSTGGRFPSPLAPGDSVDATILASAAVKKLLQKGFSGQVEIRGIFKDALGRGYHSDLFSFDTNHEYTDQ